MIDEDGKRKAKPQAPAIPPHISEDFTPAQKKAFATAKQSAPAGTSKGAAKKSGATKTAKKAATKAPATKGAAKKATRTKKVTPPRPADTEPASE